MLIVKTTILCDSLGIRYSRKEHPKEGQLNNEDDAPLVKKKMGVLMLS